MALIKYARFVVLASAVADEHGVLPAGVMDHHWNGDAFSKHAHRHHFHYDPKPGYLYVRSRAISSRTNDNYDTFPAHSIKEAWRTFVGKPVFVNHNNDNHKRARGVVIDAALHEDMTTEGKQDTWVEVLMEVDAVRFPKLAEAVVNGWIDRTSMGTEVALSTCSYCGNQAENPAQYCSHIPGMKGQRITRTTASGRKESVLVTEICEGLSFFENSLLVEAPADPTAKVWGIDSSHMSPSTASLDVSDQGRSYTESHRNMTQRHALFNQAPNDSHVGFGQTAGMVSASDQTASSGHHVSGVHGVRSQQPVDPVLAQRKITGVSNNHTGRDGTDQMDVSPSVGTNTSSRSSSQAESSIPTVEGAARPRPARGRSTTSVNLGEVPFHLGEIRDESAGGRVSGHDTSNQSKTSGKVWDWWSGGPHGTKPRICVQDGCDREAKDGERLCHGHQWEQESYRAPTPYLTEDHGYAMAKMASLDDFTDYEIIEAESILTTAVIDGIVGMGDCPQCGSENVYKDMDDIIGHGNDSAYMCGDCGWHGTWGTLKREALIDGSGACGAYNCNCPAYRFKSKQGVYPTCECGHSMNVHSSPEGSVQVVPKRKQMFGKIAANVICPACAIYTFDANDEISGRLQGPGCYDCHYTGLVPSDRTWGGPLHPRVQDMLGSKTGLGEKTAPAEVDTLRLESCPVCSDPDSFNGTQCAVCGFIKPPDLFDDPDLERAKQVDLRGGDADGAADPSQPTSELECDSCGATFPLAAAKVKPSSTKTPAPGPDLQSMGALPNAVPKPKPTAKPNPFAKNDDDDKKKKSLPPWLKKDDDTDPDVDPKAPPVDDKKTQGPAKLPQNPDVAQPDDSDVPTDPAPKDPTAKDPADPNADPADPTAKDPNADPDADPADPDPNAPLAAGDTCPTCGAGTLNEIPIETDPVATPSSGGDDQGDAGMDLADPNADPDADPGVGKRDPNQPTDPKDDAAKPDKSKPAAPDDADKPDAKPNPFAKGDDKAAPDDDEPDDDADPKAPDDKKKKSLPPWMKKKTSHRAGLPSKERVDEMTNPAQGNRNRLIEALRAQQFQIRTQAERSRIQAQAMLTLAQAAGVAGHPHFAALRRVVADDPNGPLPADDTAAAAPAATDDPTNIGAAPSSANTGVTPDGVTDVSNTNVALPTEPFGDLQDVTAPGSDIDPPVGDAAHVETDVRVGTPSTEAFPDNSGWKSSSREDPHVRLMASLRLAKMRKSAGIGGDTEEMSLGQAISDDRTLSLATIQHEISMLSALSKVKAPAGKTAARSLVPQRAPEVPRSIPSLSTQASERQSDGTPDPLADSLI